MKKALFIYNPNAGKGLLKPKLSDIIDIIVKQDMKWLYIRRRNIKTLIIK